MYTVHVHTIMYVLYVYMYNNSNVHCVCTCTVCVWIQSILNTRNIIGNLDRSSQYHPQSRNGRDIVALSDSSLGATSGSGGIGGGGLLTRCAIIIILEDYHENMTYMYM